eukprot:169835_1
MKAIPMERWMIDVCAATLFLILNCIILIKEFIKVKSRQIHFDSRSIQICPLACILCGVLLQLCGSTSFFIPFCYFSRQIQMALNGFQGVFIGFFQLSRLYTTMKISKNKCRRVYTQIMFILMYGIGIIIVITLFIFSVLFHQVQHCSINKRFEFIQSVAAPWKDQMFLPLILTPFLYMTWDLIILSLYVYKLMSFNVTKSKNIRIRLILIRILILAALYHIVLLLLLNQIWIDKLLRFTMNSQILPCLLSLSMSYSVYLMQGHNSDAYKSFLMFIHFLRIDYICCCCCKSVIYHELNPKKRTMEITTNDRTSNATTGMEDTSTTGIPSTVPKLTPDSITSRENTIIHIN